MGPAPLIEFALHVEEPGLVGLIIQVHGWFLRLHNSVGSLPAFAMCTAFPYPDYYAGSVPLINHLPSPWLARLRCRAVDQGSHVPALDLHLIGGMLYPWRYGATAYKEDAVAESAIRPHQWRTSRPTSSDRIDSQPHLANRGSIEHFKTEASCACFVVSP